MAHVVSYSIAPKRSKAPQFLESMRQLFDGDVHAFTRYLEKFVSVVPSYHDTKGLHKEQFFHGLVTGMMANASHIYHIRSNRESGGGRYDLAFEPHAGRNFPGIVIEMKVAQEDDDLDAVAQRAYAQIQRLDYTRDLKAKGVGKILTLGIAFRDKEISVVTDPA